MSPPFHLGFFRPSPIHRRAWPGKELTVSEVHRYQVVTMLSDAGNKIAYDPHGPWIVMAADHDRVTADQKEGIAKHWQVVCDQRAKIDALQQRLTAAGERNDEAIDLLRRARAVIEGGGWADLESDIAKFFKPAEGGGDEG